METLIAATDSPFVEKQKKFGGNSLLPILNSHRLISSVAETITVSSPIATTRNSTMQRGASSHKGQPLVQRNESRLRAIQASAAPAPRILHSPSDLLAQLAAALQRQERQQRDQLHYETGRLLDCFTRSNPTSLATAERILDRLHPGEIHMASCHSTTPDCTTADGTFPGRAVPSHLRPLNAASRRACGNYGPSPVNATSAVAHTHLYNGCVAQQQYQQHQQQQQQHQQLDDSFSLASNDSLIVGVLDSPRSELTLGGMEVDIDDLSFTSTGSIRVRELTPCCSPTIAPHRNDDSEDSDEGRPYKRCKISPAASPAPSAAPSPTGPSTPDWSPPWSPVLPPAPSSPPWSPDEDWGLETLFQDVEDDMKMQWEL